MSYQVTIKTTQKELQPESQSYKNLYKKSDKGEDDWGYVTKPAYTKIVTKTVFEQTIEEIDILKVIAALNNIDL